jgi:NodT family efflux transporter outer membrane factor (OMF) lipoprotein
MIGLATLLAGCALSETTVPESRVAIPAAFDQQSSLGVPISADVLDHWWTVWRDQTLTGLVGEAMDVNIDIRIARSRVAEARSLVIVGESALYPTVAAMGGVWGGEADWRNRTLDALAPKLSSGVDAHLVGLGASWEPDIFGGRNDDAEAARAVAVSVEEQLSGARMIVAADVAENYLEARGLQRRLIVLDGGIAAVGQLLGYVQGRFDAGQALRYDVELVRERLETLRGKRPALASLLDMRLRRLAILCGRTPETAIAFSASPGPFWLPPVPLGQMPVAVLERRPDVRAQAALVRAQTARLASVKTDMLPRFEIEFLGQDGHLHFAGVPGLSGTGGLLGLSVQLPIFTAGKIQANIDANDARLEAAAAAYDKIVLLALEDVENAYGVRYGLDRRDADLTRALSIAERNVDMSRALYENGHKTLQDVLNARLDVFERQDELIQTQMGQATATVQLYRALGGGW